MIVQQKNLRRREMVYNFNLGIGWASSGVEYIQACRAKIFRGIDQEVKFVFMVMKARVS